MSFLERIAQLSEEQQACLAEDNPLSFAQQRLWFIDQLAPGGAFYNTPAALRLRGRLNIEALQRTLDEIESRHEALRTSFPTFQGKPFQMVSPATGIPMPFIDLRDLPDDTREAEVRRLATEEVQRPFDLLHGPVIRARLFCLTDKDHVLVLTMHHIVSDGWSVGVLANEICTLYGAFRDGRPSPLPELPIQYGDFAQWQRDRLSDEAIANDLAYWRERLTDVPVLELTTDYVRPPIELFRGSREFAMLPQELALGLRELGQREGSTLFMVLLAAFKVLLHRYTNQDDISVASAIANRNRPELEALIGFFVNTLVMRTSLRDEPSFVELLRRVRETALGAYDHQDLPFERLVEELNPVRDMSRSPLAQVAFSLQNAPRTTMELPGLTIARQDFDLHTSRVDIEWHVWEEPDGLRCMVAYSTDLFEAATIRRMLEHFEEVLRNAVAHPEQAIGELPIMTEAERLRILEDWGRNPCTYPTAPLVHELIAKHACDQPDALAVVGSSASLTYAELNARANRLAARLQAMGVGPEQAVAVCLGRSPELITAILAIWKAGGAYVPIDPDYPSERIHFVLGDCAARIAITDEKIWCRIAHPNVAAVFADSLSIAGEQDAASPVCAVTPDNLAYIIYTSGSTGQPKGVAVEHRTLLNFLHWQAQAVEAAPGVRAAQMASPSFDASVAEIWPALAYGATIYHADDDARMSPEGLRDWIVERGLHVAFATTVIAEGLIDVVWPANGPFRTLFTGGEALTKYPSPHLPFQFSNNYGPTENTVAASMGIVPSVSDPMRLPTIGRPSGNVEIYILDGRMRPVPIGVPGEICLGGKSVARGYLNRPELTAEHFVSNPLGEGRLYKTGDRARFLDNGEIEFLGRLDDQVKVRGYRIELGEIESVLKQHAAVCDAAVIVREDSKGDRRITAYVVQDSGYRGSDTDAAARNAAEASQVEQWRTLYDDAYRQGFEQAASDENFLGWNSSYTGDPIPLDEMREWVEGTAARIRALNARSILEIGCGSGLLISRVAPGTERYQGIDLSEGVLAHARSLLAARPDLAHVELRHGAADALEGFATASFDAIVLNSVIQYFPSIDYLLKVIEGAARLLRPGGQLFLGDVRSYPLLEFYAASVCLYQADDALTRGELAERVRSRIRDEEELCVAPAFWHALRTRLPRITRVRTEPRSGRAHNELTCFRYDAIVKFDTPTSPVAAQWRDWTSEAFTLATLDACLAKGIASPLCFRGIPNARVERERALVTWLHDEHDDRCDVAAFRAQSGVLHGIEPDDLHTMAARHGYRALLDVARGGDVFDAAFLCDDVTVVFPGDDIAPRPWDTYANNPLSGMFARTLVPELRHYLHERLPDYMEPSAFVLMNALPLTTHGKVDRRALPEPDRSRRGSGLAYVAPRTATEEIVAEIWREMLSVDQVGVEDTFFALGGHSLLATQVMSRVRARFGVEIALRVFFEDPTVGALAARIETAKKTVAPPLVARPDSDRVTFPLSFAQQRLWFIDQLAPDSTAYAIPSALRLSGALDGAVLEKSLQELIRRHEGLRTVFETTDGEAVQRITSPHAAVLKRETVAELPEGEREDAVRRLIRAEVSAPFDLARGPLIRGRLITVTENEHVLVLVLHHIISDGWSMGVLGRELGALYTAFAQGGTSPLSPLPIQYADFATWQRGWLQGEALESEIAYWRKWLADAPALQLQTDHPRPALQTFSGARVRRLVARPLADKLTALSEREGVTLFMTLLAAFNALLARYTGQDDIVVGSAIANRNRTETEGLIGFFVNSLVLRTRVDGDPTFVELLHRVRKGTLEAFEHQDVPFEKLVEEIEPIRDLSRNPLFQVMFLLQNAPRAELALPGVDVGLQEMPETSVRFDLEFHVWESADGFVFTTTYSTDLFDEPTIARLITHFERVLETVATDPLRRVSEVELLDGTERQQVLVKWNATTTPYPRDASIQQLFESQALATPDAVAVIGEDVQWTYAELNARANRVAHRLRGSNIACEATVGLCMERSAAMVAATLGILKAGGAYLPLDPSYPAPRLDYMMRDACPAAVLVSSATRDRLSPVLEHFGAPVIDVDEILAWPGADENPRLCSGAENLAYIMYTSGSTGQPKGVCVEHRSVVRLVRNTNYVDLGPGETLLHFAPISFDASTFEIWGALLNGAKLVVYSAELPTLEDLGDTIVRCGVTTLWLTAGLFHQMVEGNLDCLRGVRQLLAGGDVLSHAHVRKLLEALPGTTVINGYGPTECTTFTCCHPIRSAGDLCGTVPIGRPISNTQVYVLDSARRPVPVGVPGELYVGGDGLARGYLNASELTVERFVANPFGAGRLYRTGDSVRYLPDGRIEFLGRHDDQVKVRGFRIELAEIENALTRHGNVREAAVTVREDRSGNKQIVAYVSLNDKAKAGGDILREYLKTELPAHMVPAFVVVIESLPLTPNGKVNRRALPAPVARDGADGRRVAPRTPCERVLTEIWREVLGVPEVGVEDDFFALGGHSLLATQLASRVRDRFGVNMPLREFFSAPTIALLATKIEQAQKQGGKDTLMTVNEDMIQSHDALADLDGMTDAEMDALLTQLTEESEQ